MNETDKQNRQSLPDTVQTMAHAADTLRRNGSPQTRQNLLILDSHADFMLKREFNRLSGVPATAEQKNFNNHAVRANLEISAISNSDVPEDINSREKFSAYEKSKHYDLDTLQGLINATPAMAGFSLADAVALAGDEQQQRSVLSRYPNADHNILMATAYTLLDNSKTELARDYPAFAGKHAASGTNFSDTASSNIFYVVQDDQTYKNWEQQKRAQIIDKIARDPIAQTALQGIVCPLSTKSTHDIIAQYGIRQQFAQRLAVAYADVYGLQTLGIDDVKVLHNSLQEIYKNGENNSAWQTRAGVRNDELVVLSHNPVYGLLLLDNPETTDNAARKNFIKVAVEELQHATDHIYADKLINKEIDSTHPAFNHTAITLLNRLNFTNGNDFDGYNAQIMERSAKEIAADATTKIMSDFMSPPQAVTPQATQQFVTTAIPSTTNPPAFFQKR